MEWIEPCEIWLSFKFEIWMSSIRNIALAYAWDQGLAIQNPDSILLQILQFIAIVMQLWFKRWSNLRIQPHYTRDHWPSVTLKVHVHVGLQSIHGSCCVTTNVYNFCFTYFCCVTINSSVQYLFHGKCIICVIVPNYHSYVYFYTVYIFFLYVIK